MKPDTPSSWSCVARWYGTKKYWFGLMARKEVDGIFGSSCRRFQNDSVKMSEQSLRRYSNRTREVVNASAALHHPQTTDMDWKDHFTHGLQC